MDLLIRSANAEDEIETINLWRACGLVMDYNDPVAEFQFARAKPNSDILLGVDTQNRIIGSVMIGHDGHLGWIYYVAVHPDLQRKNIGRRMVEAGEKWLHNYGMYKVLLLIRETNSQVEDFYKRVGYKTIPRIVMSKWLKK